MPPASPPPTQEPPGPCTDVPAVIGFAAVNVWGQNGTTGGCGGATVTVSDATAFLAAIARPAALIIRVSGVLTLPGPMHDVASNKTIVGVGVAQDTGQLKVTYHHNFFDNTPQRNPRVRFGEPVHVFNNYYLHNTDIGVACQASSGCVIENNVFENTEEAYSIDYAGPHGRIVARGNLFIGESAPGTIGGTVQEPSTYYSYTAQSADTVKAAVLAGAGTGHI